MTAKDQIDICSNGVWDCIWMMTGTKLFFQVWGEIRDPVNQMVSDQLMDQIENENYETLL